MLRTILMLTLLSLSLLTHAAKVKTPGDRLFMYRYTLCDKQPTTYSLDKPHRFLSRKSIERRHRQGLAIDSTDLPVPRAYVKQFQLEATRVVGTSRWHNAVLVCSSDSSLLNRLARLPIVSESRCVFVSPDSIEPIEDIRWNIKSDFNRWDSVHNDHYGMARQQIEAVAGQRLHERGYYGKGMTIAVLDGGFQNYQRIPALRKINIAGTHDFVPAPRQTDPAAAFQQIDHGTKVLSVLAASAPEVTMGTAPDAAYWLLRCEDPRTEQRVEEDYWTMAAEFADSVGADIINSSLGYYHFDDGCGDYRLQDLDGKTAYISQSAAMLAHKGIVLCNSAGNAGMGSWKKIGVPADAPDILTVGAIDKNNRIAAFSSVGPTQDGRVKPDIVSQGAPTTVISGRGALLNDMGTSFSTPIISGLIACLWQALPQKAALEIIELVRQSANQHDNPTNIYGYGIPNFWKAYQAGNPHNEKQ